MDDNERTLRIDEYKKLRDQLIHEMNNDEPKGEIIDFPSGDSSSKKKTLNNGHYKESNNQFDYIDRKAGMVNVLTLSIFTFIFECLFIFLSFMIFN